MNWDAFGALGEWIGAIAVLVTLIYLSIQVRHSIKTAKASTYQGIFRDFSENLHQMPDEIGVKVLTGELLDEREVALLNRWRITMLRCYENIWMQHRYEVIDDSVLETYLSHLQNTLWMQGGVSFWKRKNIKFDPEFEEYVNTIVGELEERAT